MGGLLGSRSNVSRGRGMRKGVLESSQSSVCLYNQGRDYQEFGGFGTKGSCCCCSRREEAGSELDIRETYFTYEPPCFSPDRGA